MLVGTVSFANPGDPIKKLPVETATTVKTEVVKKVVETKVADDAIYCSVTIGDVSMSCWFCNCNDLRLDALIAAGY